MPSLSDGVGIRHLEVISNFTPTSTEFRNIYIYTHIYILNIKNNLNQRQLASKPEIKRGLKTSTLIAVCNIFHRAVMSTAGDFGNPLRKFKLVFLGEQSGEYLLFFLKNIYMNISGVSP